jgi:hypothetical protein
VSRESNHTSAGEPSFYYLMMADGCFRRSAKAGKAGTTLRDIGRDYLAKATTVTSAFARSQLSADVIEEPD